MSAQHSGNSIIPSQGEHDENFATNSRVGALTLGRLTIEYTYDEASDSYQIDDAKLTPTKVLADLWRNADPGARLIDAVGAVLAAWGGNFAELIEEQSAKIQTTSL